MRRKIYSLCGRINGVETTFSRSNEENIDRSKSMNTASLEECSQTLKIPRSQSFTQTLRRGSAKIFRRRSANYRNISLRHLTNSASAQEDQKNVTGQNKLHVVCLTHPPLFIVEAIIRDFPTYVADLDSMGRSPLHIAAARGASPEVIHCILKKNPAVASLQDVKGKTPLILSCQYCCKERACDTGNKHQGTVKGPLVSVIKALCKEAPLSVNVEDKQGTNALQYAVEMGASPKVINILHKVSKVGWDS